VLGQQVFIDGQLGEDGEEGEDEVMRFDRSATRGFVLPPPVPTGCGPDA